MALLVGKNVATDRQAVWQQTGYCPQFDALFDKVCRTPLCVLPTPGTSNPFHAIQLTAREHLEIYGHIRGIKPAALQVTLF